MNRSYKAVKSVKHLDLVISDDVEPTESYVGVGDNNLVLASAESENINLSLAQFGKNAPQKTKHKSVESKSKSSRKSDVIEKYHKHEIDKEKIRSITPRDSKNYKVDHVPTLPELKAKFSMIEKELAPEKAESINNQIEKLAHRKHKLTIAEKMKQMKEIRAKSTQNWSKFKSEIDFVKEMENKNSSNCFFEETEAVSLKDEIHLDAMVNEICESEKENIVVKEDRNADENVKENDDIKPINNVTPAEEEFDIDINIKPMQINMNSVPITREEAMDLKQLLFNSPNRCWGSEWYRQNIEFHPIQSETPFAMIQKMSGPNNVMTVIQAEFIVEALFFRKLDVNWIYNVKKCRNNILSNSLSRIIARCKGDNKTSLKVCLWDKHLKGRKLGLIKEDGIVECLQIYEFTDETKLIQFLQHHINQFIEPQSPGLILLIVSCLLSFGLSRCKKILNSDSARLISPLGFARTELFHLLMTGCFTGHVFNDKIIETDDNKSVGKSNITHEGISRRSSLGFLSVDSSSHCKYCNEVGTYLKTPKYPVWILKWFHEEYCVVYCENKTLISDWKTEIRFKLYMYSPRFIRPRIIPILVDSSKAAVEQRSENIEKMEKQYAFEQQQQLLMEQRLKGMSDNARQFLLDTKDLNNEKDEDESEWNQNSHITTMNEDEAQKSFNYLDSIIHTKWQTATTCILNDEKQTDLSANNNQLALLFKK